MTEEWATNTNEHTGITLLIETFRRWERTPPCVVALPKHEAWTLMGLLQLLHRHPHLEPTMLDFIQRLGRGIQEALCDTAQLYAFAEDGWNPALDYDPEQDQKCPTGPPAPIVGAISNPTSTLAGSDGK
ncbi:MAG: hypothetical protein ACRDTG_28450 [Pseudonocardiaceae bacterium]